MTNDQWKSLYEQLNQRSRLYSSQLWYVPFAYIALVGIGMEKILAWPQPSKSFGLIFMGIFSIAVFVHVSSIKFLERRAVKKMRELEGDSPVSIGGGYWYLSFAWYIRLLLFILSYFFIAYGISQSLMAPLLQSCWFWIPMGALTIFYAVLMYKDRSRNKALVKGIRDDK
jgi:hypothetical protein